MSDRPFVQRLGLALLTASVPILVMFILITLQGFRWNDHVPALGDEIDYWHQAGTWAQAGVNGGYYVIDDTPARASFAHYYAWGFGPPVFYGVFAKLFGWPLNGVLNVNVLFFFLSVAAFVLLARLDARRCLILAVLLAVYPAILVYMPTSMLEPIYLGGVLVFAGGLYRMHRGEREWWLIALTGATLVLLSIMRFTWALMFWPYLYYLAPWRVWTLRSRSPQAAPTAPIPSDASTGSGRLQGRDIAAPFPGERRWLWSLIGTVVITGLFFVLYNLTASPYRYPLAIILGMIPSDASSAFLYFIDMVRESVIWLVIPFYGNADISSYLPSVTPRLVLLGLMIWAVVQRRHARTRLQREEITIVLYIVGSAIALALFVYSTVSSVGFRFFAPYVLMALAFCLAGSRMRVVYAATALFVISLPLAFMNTGIVRSDEFAPNRANDIAAYRQEWQDLGVTYRPDADPWCNTLAYSISYLGTLPNLDRLLALDAGMGISIVWWEPFKTQRAHYLMLDEKYYADYPNKEQLSPVLDVVGGAVYRNEAVVCP
jgi:hypothetical protein